MSKTKPASRRSLPRIVKDGLRWATGIGYESRASVEDPTTPLDAQSIESWLGGGQEFAGATVNENAAAQFATAKSCVAILAESLAVLPLGMYEAGKDGSRARAESHPADVLIHEQPNEEQTSVVWREHGQTNFGFCGNAVSRIAHNGGGRPVEIVPVLPDAWKTARHKATRELRYLIRDDGRPSMPTMPSRGSEWVPMDPAQIIHVPGFGTDGLHGLSPVGLMRKTLGIGIALEHFTANALANGAWLGHVLEHPETLSEGAYDRLRRSIDKTHGGIANVLKPAILEEGLKLNQMSMPGEDALFLAVRKFAKREICAWYRVPPHMVADMEGGASFASVEHMSLEFVMFTMGVYLRKWEAELTRKLGGNVRGKPRRFFASFNADAFLRGATSERYAAFKIGREGGWLNANEIRAKDNMGPIPGGDRYLTPLNMGDATQPTKPATDSRAMVEATRAVAGRVAYRAARVEADRLPRLVDDEAKRAAFWNDQRARLVDELTPIVDMARHLRSGPDAGSSARYVGRVVSNALVEVPPPSGDPTDWTNARASALGDMIATLIEHDTGE